MSNRLNRRQFVAAATGSLAIPTGLLSEKPKPKDDSTPGVIDFERPDAEDVPSRIPELDATMNPVSRNLDDRDGLPASPFRTDDW
jgi:hypothetical protein